MEGIIKESVKIESNFLGSSTSSSSIFPDLFDDHHHEGVYKNNSLGFMELLGMHHDFGGSFSMFDVLHEVHPSMVVQSCSKISELNTNNQLQPATPNSSSVSSASSEALNDESHVKLLDIEEQDEDEDEDQEQQNTKKEMNIKTKKTNNNNQKRQREPRFAFMTKSEVDHLEDGYRWRKYGQKAVKNSPFPRSYYRCTSSSCNVKKRVERSFSDPTIVVTTYEGQHTHQSPVMPRSTAAHHSYYSQSNLSSLYQPQFINTFSPVNYLGYANHNNYISNNASVISSFLHHDQKRYCTAPSRSATALVEDHGLLQDVVPSHMLKQE